MQVPRYATGSYTGAGAVLSVKLNFKPRYLVIWNETDGTSRFECIDGLAADKAYQVIDSGTGTTDLSILAANGVTLSSFGFTVGTSIATSAKVFRYFAIG